MTDNKFLNAMIAYKHFDNTQRFKQSQREKKRKREDFAKKSASPKEDDSVSHKRGKRPPARAAFGNPKNQTTFRTKKFCQHCKDSNGKYWTHNTEDCYFKKPARESNAIKALKKEFNKLKDVLKNLKKHKDSDSDSE